MQYLHIGTQNAEFIIDQAYEEYLNEALKGDNADPVDVSEKMQNLIKNKQIFSATPIGPIANHISSQSFSQVMSASFASSYVANNCQDADLLRKLFLCVYIYIYIYIYIYTCVRIHVCAHIYSMHMVASTLKFMKCIHEFIPYRIGHQMTRINCKQTVEP